MKRAFKFFDLCKENELRGLDQFQLFLMGKGKKNKRKKREFKVRNFLFVLQRLSMFSLLLLEVQQKAELY